LHQPLLMTGATGFLGRNLLSMLATEFPRRRLLALCRSDTAAEQLWHAHQGGNSEQLGIIRGDIDLPGLGLSTEDLADLSGVTEVWHVAASTSFDDRDRSAIFHTNVGGTSHVLSVAQKLPQLARFYYVSTAYVAGTAGGLILEDELPAPSGFRNAYEESKWTAEKAVRESGLPFIILRPSIVMGDSRTYESQGETRMVYGYLLGLYYAIRKECQRQKVDFHELWHSGTPINVPTRLIGHHSTAKNFICIDEFLRAVKAILRHPNIHRTFNLTSPFPITIHQVKMAAQAALGITGLHCVGEHIDAPSAIERAARAFTRPFAPYTLGSDPVWSLTNTDQALSPAHGLISMTGEVFSHLLRWFVEHDLMATEPRHAVV
jgi:nucleoside-diphosphate-sugar epimerase